MQVKKLIKIKTFTSIYMIDYCNHGDRTEQNPIQSVVWYFKWLAKLDDQIVGVLLVNHEYIVQLVCAWQMLLVMCTFGGVWKNMQSVSRQFICFQYYAFSSSEILVNEPRSGSVLWNWEIKMDSQGAGVSGISVMI